MVIPKEYTDINGLVTPSICTSEKPADNCVLYTSVAAILNFEIPNYSQLIRDCYLQSGLVARWKGNNFDQAAWDDYLGIACACIHLRITDIPREILWYGLKHAFIFNTDNKLEFRDWLGRNLPVWILMWCAAFPMLKALAWLPMWLTQLTFKPLDFNDTSSIQLQWLFLLACMELGHVFNPRLAAHQTGITEAFKIYYSKYHPFNHLGEI